ncbi:MAG: sigma-70 family RNA polymerase sigma factor [Oscillospiraceae bacterium]|nr:sigma-70 family RNA polymerase sigma factor [Oscillospiraceae bacterium]MDE7170322.1 sigma-70 family RNA polymerase sigma factor [Oscillospiraceae bacterium]
MAKQANRRMAATGGFGGVEFGDLYDSGYIALVAAVESFDPEAGGSFIGWLALHLKTTFAEAGGYRSRKQAQDPLHRAGSLDVPMGDDEDGATLREYIADPVSTLDFERVEECQYRTRLRAELGTALGRLPAHCRNIIQRRFYRGQTSSAIAAEMGVQPEIVRKWEGEALKQLRHPRTSRPLRGYLTGRG